MPHIILEKKESENMEEFMKEIKKWSVKDALTVRWRKLIVYSFCEYGL